MTEKQSLKDIPLIEYNEKLLTIDEIVDLLNEKDEKILELSRIVMKFNFKDMVTIIGGYVTTHRLSRSEQLLINDVYDHILHDLFLNDE